MAVAREPARTRKLERGDMRVLETKKKEKLGVQRIEHL